MALPSTFSALQLTQTRLVCHLGVGAGVETVVCTAVVDASVDKDVGLRTSGAASGEEEVPVGDAKEASDEGEKVSPGDSEEVSCEGEEVPADDVDEEVFADGIESPGSPADEGPTAAEEDPAEAGAVEIVEGDDAGEEARDLRADSSPGDGEEG